MSEGSENKVLCGASSYNEKYYLNPEFEKLPDAVKKEIQILCVCFTEEVGGILTLEFSKEGKLLIKTAADEFDFYYDEIEAGIQVRNLQREKEELFTQLELFYRIVFLGEGS